MTTLLERIDFALHRQRMTRAEFARALGISVQAVTALGRRPHATMKHSNIVKAAEVLRCDLKWLASGDGEPGAAPLDGATITVSITIPPELLMVMV